MEFLLNLVRTESLDAEGAIEAILRAAPSHEIVSALESLVRDNPRLSTAFAAHRSSRLKYSQKLVLTLAHRA